MKCFAYTRQMKGCLNNVDDYVIGTKGRAEVLQFRVNGERVFRGRKPSMYDVEHQELFAAIRAGKTINNGRYMAYSTMMAILGREVCYSGQKLTWDQLMKSDLRLGPTEYKWGDVTPDPIRLPGIYKFA